MCVWGGGGVGDRAPGVVAKYMDDAVEIMTEEGEK